ncbi:hypothetical protein DM860_005583 [Cuscuta australis]|uniref:EamA domain-containing protein n=1 Tax=Cuscuta australis TaxID=267555 RepID=A0A328DUS8_9ASTE|nr:hypothetical protein DM860_005583 [Cuscuta australis]
MKRIIIATFYTSSSSRLPNKPRVAHNHRHHNLFFIYSPNTPFEVSPPLSLRKFNTHILQAKSQAGVSSSVAARRQEIMVRTTTREEEEEEAAAGEVTDQENKKTAAGKCSWAAPVVAMVAVQVMFAGSQILTKLAINEGMLVLAILTYRHIVAALCIAPLAFLLDRRKIGENLTPNVCLWTFITALTGITLGMGLFYYGLKDTSATYATNFSNLIPIVTFFFSILVRMESLKLGTRWGQLKIVGAFLCVGGALVISLYKGVSLSSFHHKTLTTVVLHKTNQHMTRGTILLVASCLGYAVWFISQAQLLKVLPSKNLGNLLTCVMASIQTAILGICLDRSGNSWSLGWNVKLMNVLFSGAFASAASFYLIIWAVEKKGPSYPSMFDPLSVVFVAIIEAIFFGEDFTLGILLGMILMIAGLYSYLWGKRGESESSNSAAEISTLDVDKEVVVPVTSHEV